MGAHHKYSTRPTDVRDAEYHNWKLDALCRGQDPEPWFPVRRVHAGYGQSICETCPVMMICREESLDRQERFGTFGGLSQWQRRAILGIPEDW
jgi:WhiB family redox-sensing transcriptional regulator